MRPERDGCRVEAGTIGQVWLFGQSVHPTSQRVAPLSSRTRIKVRSKCEPSVTFDKLEAEFKIYVDLLEGIAGGRNEIW
jgi:hypothetical protein